MARCDLTKNVSHTVHFSRHRENHFVNQIRAGDRHLDRFLFVRDNKFHYRRRVPLDLAKLDSRYPQVRRSLKTDDIVKARAIRDILERADNELWASLLAGSTDDPWERHEATQRLARSMGFSYLSTHDVSAASLATILARVEALKGDPVQKAEVEAVLGAVDEPVVTINKALETYLDKIAAPEVRGKSSDQKRKWENGKRQSVEHFIEVVGDIDMRSLTREHGRKYHEYWVDRIAPKEGAPTHTADIGNRRLGDLAVLYRSYFTYMQEPDRENPFEKLRFKRTGKRKRRRPSFSYEWITKTLLKPGNLDGMNDQARAIFLVVANTGARPGEIANLVPDRIVLDHKIPHIKIEPDEDPDDPREIKTETSIRVVPLVGLALEVMKRYPNGFGRYRDKGSSLSAAVGKYMRNHGLMETPKHKFYSLRHSFEDRMKEARVDSELRNILMGHAIDRPEYGEGGSLRLRREAMEKVTLPFDPSIVPTAS